MGGLGGGGGGESGREKEEHSINELWTRAPVKVTKVTLLYKEKQKQSKNMAE